VRGSKITKRGDSYSFRYDLPSGPDGMRQQKTETVRGSYKDAERRQREILSQIDQGQFSWAPVRTTLGEFLNQYLENIKGMNNNTYSIYCCSFNSFKRCLGADLMLADLKTLAIQQALNTLATTKLDRSTTNLYFQKLNIAMKYACRPSIRYLISNPCADVIVTKADVKEKQVWDDNQSNQFIRFCRSSLLRYTTMFVLLLKTGARIGEVLALRWTDVDLDAGTIHITRTVLRHGAYGSPKSQRSLRKVSFDQGP
jgi:integrase